MIPSLLLVVAAHAADCPQPTEPERLLVDPEIVDDMPPGPPQVRDVNVDFAMGSGCADCPDTVTLTALFDPSEDDLTAPEDLGYRLELVDGTLPPGITLPEDPILGPEAVFVWSVDRTIVEEDLFLAVRVTTIDEAGNASSGTATVEVRQSAIDLPFTCATGGRGGAPVALLAGLLAVGRRYRAQGRVPRPVTTSGPTR